MSPITIAETGRILCKNATRNLKEIKSQSAFNVALIADNNERPNRIQ